MLIVSLCLPPTPHTGPKLYLPSDCCVPVNREHSSTAAHYNALGSKLDFKTGCPDSGPSGIGGGAVSAASSAASSGQLSASPDSQQFNIFPAIFSRQLNFTGSTCGGTGGGVGATSSNQNKLMDDLRPNLVGGLLGLQQGLLDDHTLGHGNLQHNAQDTKFMSLQDNRLMGIGPHENRLLGLSQENRTPVGQPNLDKPIQRKCSSTPEDFSSLYGGLAGTPISDHHHHHTPAHTPPNRLSDNTSLTGMSAEDEWYNKSLSALRMNSSHHPNLSAPMLQYQT
ncbi:hypothetical protein quinque_016033 [Culex quinquefasciatus]